MRNYKVIAAIMFYLGAIVLANLLVSWYGPEVIIATSLLLIGVDFTTKDILQEEWEKRGRIWFMGLLILGGGILSAVVAPASINIAVASMLAFMAAALVDAVCFYLLRSCSFTLRANLSNIPGAAVDSYLFPLLAFGSVSWPIFAGQVGAKLLGGFIFSLIILLIRSSRQEQPSY